MAEFDYIVVGAGSSGCAVAARLADSGAAVALVEAGGSLVSPLVTMPRGFGLLWEKKKNFWRFDSASGRTDDSLHYGRGLGGSSAVNGMWYLRGEPADYDRWSPGSAIWNWSRAEAAFAEFENFRSLGTAPGRGRTGPLEVTRQSLDDDIADTIFRAGAEFGLAHLEDINTPGASGIGFSQQTVGRDGGRTCAYSAFVTSRSRANLKTLSHSVVNRVIIENGRATGVEIAGRRGVRRITARREIILSAGVIQSPKLLQLSGVGDRALLDEHGVDTIHHLPAVGRDMRGHILLALSFQLHRFHGLNRELRGWRLARNVAEWLVLGRGVMCAGSPEITALLSSRGEPERPDVQIGISPFAAAPGNEPGRGRLAREAGITFVGFQLRPESRGNVAIQSRDPTVSPLVDADYLKTAVDIERTREVVDIIRELAAMPAFEGVVGAEMDPLPASAGLTETVLRSRVSHALHDVGTCAIGSVVDERLRVDGIAGLRVADCSVIPEPMSGNTNAAAMLVGHIAGQLLLEDAGAAA